MKTITATEARRQFFKLLKKSVSGHQEFRITTKDGDVVILSQEDYDGLLETLELLSTPGLRDSIRRARRQIERGETYPIEDLFDAK